jgi:hypothetical protein
MGMKFQLTFGHIAATSCAFIAVAEQRRGGLTYSALHKPNSRGAFCNQLIRNPCNLFDIHRTK